MAAPSLTALETAFVQGASVFRQKVLNWNLRAQGIQVRTNVNAPQALTKLSSLGEPRPYRTQDDFGAGPDFSDRTLIAYQSKLDTDFDPENFRNTYLATLPDAPFESAAIDHVAAKYLDSILRSTVYSGVRNAAGTAPADLANGFGTIIASEITATKITPIVTGAITSANAVDKVELVAEGVPSAIRESGEGIMYCSYNVFDKFVKHYRTLNGYKLDTTATGGYMLDNKNIELRPVAWMLSSQRLIATLRDNLVLGTDAERVAVYPTRHLNILKLRFMMPIGMEIQDLDALVVNDQA